MVTRAEFPPPIRLPGERPIPPEPTPIHRRTEVPDVVDEATDPRAVVFALAVEAAAQERTGPPATSRARSRAASRPHRRCSSPVSATAASSARSSVLAAIERALRGA